MGYKEEKRLKKRRQLVSKTGRLIISASITFVVIVILLFFANLFDVREISIHASGLVSEAEIREEGWKQLNERRFGIPRKNNSILFSPDKIGPALMREFPRIESVEIKRTSLHELSMTIKERTPVGLWCFADKGQCYYYDIQGIAFAEVASSSGFLFVAVNDYRPRSVELGREVAPADWRRRTLEVKKILQFGGISVQAFEIASDSRDEFTVITHEGWKILFVNNDDVRTQTGNLLVFLREKLAPQARADIEYFDLRINDRIYYKSQEVIQSDTQI